MLNLIKITKRPLIIAVGGGNDSVSAFLLLEQLSKTYGFNPDTVSILAMLPDVLDYHNVSDTNIEGLVQIGKDSYRSVQGHAMDKFPEQVLASHTEFLEQFKVNAVYGCLMNKGSIGVKHTIKAMLDTGAYDAVFAFDVGGDFIAVDSNYSVLSPMMDGYVLYALKEVITNVPVVYGVFGLGTDGESESDMLYAALRNTSDLVEGHFDKSDVQKSVSFYKDFVEPVRYSRTADFTIKGIFKEPIESPVAYRARFHVPAEDGTSHVYYGYFSHKLSEYYAGKFYLFKNVLNVKNKFSIPMANGIDWFCRVQESEIKYNNELNGQAYMDMGRTMGIKELERIRVFFGTPSFRFSAQQQIDIFNDIKVALLDNVYDCAFVWNDVLVSYGELSNTLKAVKVNNVLSLLCRPEVASRLAKVF